MKHHIIAKRNLLICESWEKHKGEGLTMEELAEIFNIDLKSIYRILVAIKENKGRGKN